MSYITEFTNPLILQILLIDFVELKFLSKKGILSQTLQVETAI
jgi:hypothetical protein